MVSPSSSTSPWVRPLAGSSISRNVGLAASARAISSRFSVPNGRPAAGRNASGPRPSSVEQVAGEVAGALVLLGRTEAEDRPAEADLALAVRTHHHVLEQRHRGEQRQVLEGAGDAELGDAVRRHVEQVAARGTSPPAGGLVDAADDVEHRGLAGTVRPDEAADLALVDAERQAVERHDAAEADRHVLHVEQHSQRPGPLPTRLSGVQRSRSARPDDCVRSVHTPDLRSSVVPVQDRRIAASNSSKRIAFLAPEHQVGVGAHRVAQHARAARWRRVRWRRPPTADRRARR